MENSIMKSLTLYLFGVLLLASLSSCASISSGGSASAYKLTLGDLEETSFDQILDRMRNYHSLEIERNDTYGSGERRLISYWKPVDYLSQQAKENKGEVRIIVEGKSINTQGYRMLSARFRGEYRALTVGEDGTMGYELVEMPSEVKNYFSDIAYDLKDFVQGTVRGY